MAEKTEATSGMSQQQKQAKRILETEILDPRLYTDEELQTPSIKLVISELENIRDAKAEYLTPEAFLTLSRSLSELELFLSGMTVSEEVNKFLSNEFGDDSEHGPVLQKTGASLTRGIDEANYFLEKVSKLRMHLVYSGMVKLTKPEPLAPVTESGTKSYVAVISGQGLADNKTKASTLLKEINKALNDIPGFDRLASVDLCKQALQEIIKSGGQIEPAILNLLPMSAKYMKMGAVLSKATAQIPDAGEDRASDLEKLVKQVMKLAQECQAAGLVAGSIPRKAQIKG